MARRNLNITSVNKELSTFLLKILCFFVVVFLLDLVTGELLRRYYFRQESGPDHLTTQAMEVTKADVMVFGSSRAVNIFNTAVIEEKTGMSCYNAGRYGEPVFYHHAVLKAVLKRYTPKIILLSFDAGGFGKNREAYERISSLLPYYEDHPEIRSTVELKGPYEKLKMESRIYPYNSLVLAIISGNSSYGKKKYPHINGFIPIRKVFAGPLQTFDYTKERSLDTIKVNAYRSFIMECKQANIPLYIVCPPYMVHPIGIDASVAEGKRIALEENVPFFDYSGNGYFTDKPGLFADYRHLNEKGAGLFSSMVITEIQKQKRPLISKQ